MNRGAGRPKSVFQIGGAGAVGTGSIRGMVALHALREAGFAIWPFDDPRDATVAEIYPRLFTGPVVKSSANRRRDHVEAYYPDVPPAMRARLAASEDAFDAAISAIEMSRHIDQLDALPRISDPVLRIEGAIWAPTPDPPSLSVKSP
jgi:hypothetical protein